MLGSRQAKAAAGLAAAVLALAGLGTVATADTRKPLSRAFADLQAPVRAFGSPIDRRGAAALRAGERGAAPSAVATPGPAVSSTHFGPAATGEVAAILRSLEHGPELGELSVYVATSAEIRSLCGTAAVACYLPDQREMVVSGVDRAVAGVPRRFAIAHEYGHHIAAIQASAPHPWPTAGTLRWASYERVCQLSRAHRLRPGDQGHRYWENPEEAFAQAYAHLNFPAAPVSWQHTGLLRPSVASLSRLRLDVRRPWSGPVTVSWSGRVDEPPPEPGSAPGVRTEGIAVDGRRAVGTRPWIELRRIATPLDGRVEVSLQAPPGSALSVALSAPRQDRTLARARADASGLATLSYANCGHAALRLEVRSLGGTTAFRAAIARP